MSLTRSRQAYNDCYEYLDRALEEPPGIRIPVKSQEEAYRLRGRLHMCRAIDREDSKATYEVGHRMHGASPYDALTCRIKSGKGGKQLYVYIEHHAQGVGEPEPLTGAEDE